MERTPRLGRRRRCLKKKPRDQRQGRDPGSAPGIWDPPPGSGIRHRYRDPSPSPGSAPGIAHRAPSPGSPSGAVPGVSSRLRRCRGSPGRGLAEGDGGSGNFRSRDFPSRRNFRILEFSVPEEFLDPELSRIPDADPGARSEPGGRGGNGAAPPARCE